MRPTFDVSRLFKKWVSMITIHFLFREICLRQVERGCFFTFVLSFENDISNEWASLALQSQQFIGITLQK